jgi:hypothetical protein
MNNINRKAPRYESIELLNFEGPVLKAHRCDSVLADGLFLIHDEWKEPIAFMNREQLENFIAGEVSITDSHGRAWNYAKEWADAKTNPAKLKNFMYPNE